MKQARHSIRGKASSTCRVRGGAACRVRGAARTYADGVLTKAEPADDRGVRTAVVGRVGHLQLNRPRTINALDQAMVSVLSARLADWRHDDRVHTIVITGAGDRGLCSGGNVRAVRDTVVRGDLATAQRYWREEYELDAVIAGYPKPVVAVMDGLVMGGGLGLACFAGTRLVTERTRIAMPETIIGFFPDVGVTYPLSRAPGRTGPHLVMTGTAVDGADAIALGLADAMIDSADRDQVVDRLATGESLDPLHRTVPPSALMAARSWIDPCYAGDDPVAVVERLRAHPDPAAQQAVADISARSPLSVWLALTAIGRAGRLASLAEVLEQDRRLSERLAPYRDLVEGVRAQLIDRDRTPRWQHAGLTDVDPDQVTAMFAQTAH